MSEKDTLVDEPAPSVYYPIEVPRETAPWLYPLFIIVAILLIQAFTLAMFVVIWNLVT
jgi:hypothetical protein